MIRRLPRRRTQIALILALAIAATTTAVHATQIVFDPTNFVKQVEQAQQEAQMVQELKREIQNQLKMIQNWGYSQLAGILQSMNQWQQVFGQSYAAADPGTALNTQFPADPQAYASTTDVQMQGMRNQWQQAQRDAVVENRTVQDHIEQDLQPTAERMDQYVQHSNGAPGTTAAVQAGNEELASVVAQVQALQALEITSAHTDAQLDAQEQAERAYHDAERQKVMDNFYTPPAPTGHVSNLFSDQ